MLAVATANLPRRDCSFRSVLLMMMPRPAALTVWPMHLPRFDYCRSGAYFITFCTAHRHPLLAEVDAGRLRLAAPGQIVADAWPDAPGFSPAQ